MPAELPRRAAGIRTKPLQRALRRLPSAGSSAIRFGCSTAKSMHAARWNRRRSSSRLSLRRLSEAFRRRRRFDSKAGASPRDQPSRWSEVSITTPAPTFEVVSSGLGAQSTVVAGGRYDGLVESLGGAPVPGIGFAIGLDSIGARSRRLRSAFRSAATSDRANRAGRPRR